MEKPILIIKPLWLVILFSFSVCFLLLSFAKSDFYSLVLIPMLDNNNQVIIDDIEPTLMNYQNKTRDISDSDSCFGRYIYVHDLPSRFNYELLNNCRSLNIWFDMCPYLENSGLGPRVENPEGVLLKEGWFSTNQFLLEMIFDNRMKRYECLTNDSSLASANYVPFYAGLDLGRYLWDYNTSIRDSCAFDIAKWLVEKPEWKRMLGRDHFFVGGRIGWDFRRQTDINSDWGNKLMSLPEFMNMTMLSIESTSWSNEFAIPYPTYFHPRSQNELVEWQQRMMLRERNHLFCFVGAPRPTIEASIRGEIINQCLISTSKTCKLLDCSFSKGNKCDNPVEVIKVFQDSVFCLQPPGDSFTRRSTFDSILAGCIPVFFHPGSAYAQYTWYFPKNYTKYSVFIPGDSIKDGRVNISKTLLGNSEDEILAMREEVIRLIPKIVYGDLEEDAFSIAVGGILQRVDNVRRTIKEGLDPSIGFAQQNSWKSKLSGTGKHHQFDQFF